MRRVPIAALLPADSPRLEGEDLEHMRILAAVESPLPPIHVHRPTMRVIDGMHRLGAAMLRGDATIEVQFFDGTEHEAFVLAVESNITHGRPLSLADRTRAAERIMAAFPAWSDRAIASAAGLGTRAVAEIRRDLDVNAPAAEVTARVGMDGKVRPLDPAEGRLRAADIIREQPDASLRMIARDAGVSPATALDVRNRMRRGEDPVPSLRKATRSRSSRRRSEGAAHEVMDADLGQMLHGLKGDPALRFSESGRSLLRWMLSRAIRPGEWESVLAEVPPHCTYIMVNVARQCADQWMQVAGELERRAGEVV